VQDVLGAAGCTMNTTHNPDGTVTVTSRGHHRLSEMLDTAALAFATERETAVGWPSLVATQEIDSETYSATYSLTGV
jgi:hypothetical protein